MNDNYREKPIKAFRIGVDPIPDWAMDRVSGYGEGSIILHSPTNDQHNPFEHMNDTYAEIVCRKSIPNIIVSHGDYIILKQNGSLCSMTKTIFEYEYEEITDDCLDSFEKEINLELSEYKDFNKNKTITLVNFLLEKIDIKNPKMYKLVKTNSYIDIFHIKKDDLDWLSICIYKSNSPIFIKFRVENKDLIEEIKFSNTYQNKQNMINILLNLIFQLYVGGNENDK